MYCPTCTTTPLVLAQRQQIAIDYCPHCRGVWLDRGALARLLERAAQDVSQRRVTPAEPDAYRASGGGHEGRRARRRKSWLSEIFD